MRFLHVHRCTRVHFEVWDLSSKCYIRSLVTHRNWLDASLRTLVSRIQFSLSHFVNYLKETHCDTCRLECDLPVISTFLKCLVHHKIELFSN